MSGIHVVMFDFKVFDIYNERRQKIGRIRAGARDLPFKPEVDLITWHFGRPGWEHQEVLNGR